MNEVATQVIVRIKPLEAVSKIVLGPISQIRVGQRRVVLRPDARQVRVQCRDVGSVQILWVIGAGIPELLRALADMPASAG